MTSLGARAAEPIGRLPISPLTILAGMTGAMVATVAGMIPGAAVSLLLGMLSGALISDR